MLSRNNADDDHEHKKERERIMSEGPVKIAFCKSQDRMGHAAAGAGDARKELKRTEERQGLSEMVSGKGPGYMQYRNEEENAGEDKRRHSRQQTFRQCVGYVNGRGIALPRTLPFAI